MSLFFKQQILINFRFLYQIIKVPNKNDLKAYNIKLPENYSTQILKIHGFKLIDPEKGLQPSNREYLFQTDHSIIQGSEAKDADQNKCEPWIPLRLFNKNETFYMNQYRSQDELQDSSFESGTPKWLFKKDFLNYTPEQLLDVLKGVSIMDLTQNKENIDDPDLPYFNFIGQEYINFQQRCEHEKQDPYVYIQYEQIQATGCEHYWRKSFPICHDCHNLVKCRFCHNNEYFDHTMDRKKTELMFCLYCGKIGKIGKYCIHCHRKISQIFCKTCKTLCNIGEDVKPAYHCDKCDCCRVGIKEFSRHCDKCNNCYDINVKEGHKCQENGICMICQEDLSESIQPEYQLPCSNKHRVHLSCYQEMLRNGELFCPLCHKLIISEDQYMQVKMRTFKIYQNAKIYPAKTYPIRYYPMVLYKCYDCETLSCDLSCNEQLFICHKCYGINCYQISGQQQQFISYQELTSNKCKDCKELTQLKQEDIDNEEKCKQHLLEWRQIHKTICPEIANNQPSDMDLLNNLMQVYDQDQFMQLLMYLQNYHDQMGDLGQNSSSSESSD